MFNFCAVMQLVNFSNIKCDIPELKGDNYRKILKRKKNVYEKTIKSKPGGDITKIT